MLRQQSWAGPNLRVGKVIQEPEALGARNPQRREMREALLNSGGTGNLKVVSNKVDKIKCLHTHKKSICPVGAGLTQA